jgi:hypothetical protein
MVAMIEPATSFRPALDAALELLPTKAHRAFASLLFDGVAARHHCRDAEPSAWPSFIAAGPTKSGKSLVASGACRVFGLDATTVVRAVPAETPRSLFGRRQQLPGGAWGHRASAVLAAPLLVLDEFDKAPRDVQRSCLKLLQGEVRVPGEEGELVEVAPTVVVLANGAVNVMPPEYRRRAILIDTAPLIDQVMDLYRVAREFLDTLPVVDLDALDVTRAPLPDAIANELVAALRAGLSEAGWRMADERALAHLVTGRAALSGLDLRAAALAVTADYLDCAETIGELAGAPGPVDPAPDAAARRHAAAEQAAHDREERRRARAEEVALAGAIGEAVDKLRSLRPGTENVAPYRHAEAARIGSQLNAVIAMASAAGSLEELREVIEDHQALISAAQAMVATPPGSDVIDVRAAPTERFGCIECGGCFDIGELDYVESTDTHHCPVCEGLELVEDEDETLALPATRVLAVGSNRVADLLRGISVGAAVTRTPILCPKCHTGTAACNLIGCPMPVTPAALWRLGHA